MSQSSPKDQSATQGFRPVSQFKGKGSIAFPLPGESYSPPTSVGKKLRLKRLARKRNLEKIERLKKIDPKGGMGTVGPLDLAGGARAAGKGAWALGTTAVNFIRRLVAQRLRQNIQENLPKTKVKFKGSGAQTRRVEALQGAKGTKEYVSAQASDPAPAIRALNEKIYEKYPELDKSSVFKSLTEKHVRKILKRSWQDSCDLLKSIAKDEQ